MSIARLPLGIDESGQPVIEADDKEELEALAESDLPASEHAKTLLENCDRIQALGESD
jgi:hypothetical protein